MFFDCVAGFIIDFDDNCYDLGIEVIPILIRTTILDLTRCIVVNPLRGFDVAIAFMVVSRFSAPSGGRISGGSGRSDALSVSCDDTGGADIAGNYGGANGTTVIDCDVLGDPLSCSSLFCVSDGGRAQSKKGEKSS